VPGVGSLAGLDARSPARDEAGTLRVLLAGSGTLVQAPTSQTSARTLLTGSALVAPSVDRLGWIWTASAADGGQLTAVSGSGQAVVIGSDWLQGRTVRSLRVARDGTRIAVVSSGPDGVSVDVAAVVRDDSGTPQQLSEASRVATTLADATRVVWVDESTLGVLGQSATGTTPVFNLVPLSGQVEARPAVADTVTIAGGKGEASLYLGTAGGGVYARSGPSWNLVDANLRDPGFPG
jgi:hypothetical protein